MCNKKEKIFRKRINADIVFMQLVYAMVPFKRMKVRMGEKVESCTRQIEVEVEEVTHF